MVQESLSLSLYLAHRGELVNYASRILGDRSHAEDVVQEAYIRFDAALKQRTLTEPSAYLYRIVRNLSLDSRRSKHRRAAHFEASQDDQITQIREQSPSPEADASAREELRLVAEAMAELPEKARIALEMHRFNGRTIKEIAAHLGISVGQAHGLIVQGVEHCRDRLYSKKKGANR